MVVWGSRFLPCLCAAKFKESNNPPWADRPSHLQPPLRHWVRPATWAKHHVPQQPLDAPAPRNKSPWEFSNGRNRNGVPEVLHKTVGSGIWVVVEICFIIQFSKQPSTFNRLVEKKRKKDHNSFESKSDFTTKIQDSSFFFNLTLRKHVEYKKHIHCYHLPAAWIWRNVLFQKNPQLPWDISWISFRSSIFFSEFNFRTPNSTTSAVVTVTTTGLLVANVGVSWTVHRDTPYIVGRSHRRGPSWTWKFDPWHLPEAWRDGTHGFCNGKKNGPYEIHGNPGCSIGIPKRV